MKHASSVHPAQLSRTHVPTMCGHCRADWAIFDQQQLHRPRLSCLQKLQLLTWILKLSPFSPRWSPLGSAAAGQLETCAAVALFTPWGEGRCSTPYTILLYYCYNVILSLVTTTTQHRETVRTLQTAVWMYSTIRKCQFTDPNGKIFKWMVKKYCHVVSNYFVIIALSECITENIYWSLENIRWQQIASFFNADKNNTIFPKIFSVLFFLPGICVGDSDVM